MGENGMDSIG